MILIILFEPNHLKFSNYFSFNNILNSQRIMLETILNFYHEDLNMYFKTHNIANNMHITKSSFRDKII